MIELQIAARKNGKDDVKILDGIVMGLHWVIVST